MSELDEILEEFGGLMYYEGFLDSEDTAWIEERDERKERVKKVFLDLVGEDTFDGSVTDAAQNLYKAELRTKIQAL